MEEAECVVVGAGVIGLAVARALATAGRDVIVLEATEAIGTETSSRNSEVIHAGIYYPRDSLMARMCVSGKEALYAYCADRGIGHRRCGKLIVATSEEEATQLPGIRERAADNGVTDLRLLSAVDVQALEPDLNAIAGLLSPSTGIVDSHAFMLALQGDAEARGAIVAFRSPLVAARKIEQGFELDVGGSEPMTLTARTIVNAAGLRAPDIARAIAGMPSDKVPTAYFAKGNYFVCAARAPFSHLIYPVPVPGGLGTHLTFDLAGQARFGPDVEWIPEVNYDVDSSRAPAFYEAVRRYWPALPDGALQPGYAGIRPKIVPPGAGRQDFVVQGHADHGIPGLVNLFGIESPGLTAALALADHVREMI